jgi:hypothetical protein
VKNIPAAGAILDQDWRLLLVAGLGHELAVRENPQVSNLHDSVSISWFFAWSTDGQEPRGRSATPPNVARPLVLIACSLRSFPPQCRCAPASAVAQTGMTDDKSLQKCSECAPAISNAQPQTHGQASALLGLNLSRVRMACAYLLWLVGMMQSIFTWPRIRVYLPTMRRRGIQMHAFAVALPSW